MKIRNLLMIALLGVIALQSCNKKDGQDIPVAVIETLKSMFPQATGVEWKQKGNYYEAEFEQNNEDISVWFMSDGAWSMTETDIPFNALPQAIRDAFNASTYASWKVDDVDKLERVNVETIYIIDVENGEAEMDLYYAEDGVLIKEVPDGDDEHTPVNVNMKRIQDFINEKYTSARILDVEREGDLIEIDIYDENTEKEVYLTDTYEWLSTTWDVTSIPTEVETALNTNYAGMTIDDMDFVEAPEGDYYVIELEQSGQPDLKIKITPQGEIF